MAHLSINRQGDRQTGPVLLGDEKEECQRSEQCHESQQPDTHMRTAARLLVPEWETTSGNCEGPPGMTDLVFQWSPAYTGVGTCWTSGTWMLETAELDHVGTGPQCFTMTPRLSESLRRTSQKPREQMPKTKCYKVQSAVGFKL